MEAGAQGEPVDAATSWRRDLRRLVLSLLLIGTLTAVAAVTPVRDWLSVGRIEEMVRNLGLWGVLLIVAIGAVAPLILVPRWPISWLCGMLYGVAWGSALACASASLGALIQFHFARTLLQPMARRLAARFKWAEQSLSQHKTFTAILLLRLFPFSNFSAVNLVAGTLVGGHGSAFLMATCIGILPTSIMFATFGKLARQPSSGMVLLLAGTLFLFALIGVAAILAIRRTRGGAAAGALSDPVDVPSEPEGEAARPGLG